MTERKEHTPEEYCSFGEVMPDLGEKPGGISTSKFVNPAGINEEAKEFKDKNPDIIKHAKKFRKDVFIYTTNHGTEVLIGTGIAATVALMTFGAVKIYKARNKK